MKYGLLRNACAACACLLAIGTIGTQAWSQGYPERPVTLIVPWPAGGSADIVLRALAESMSKHLGQRVIVENKPGAAGTVGPAYMARNSRPDGYTISQMPITVYRLPYMEKVNYDPISDFTSIIGITRYSYGTVVRADAPWKTWQELGTYARANPDKITYGSPGTGSTLHIAMEEFSARNGIKWLHVPFKGLADNLTSLMGGHISASADSSGWAEMVNAGKLRLLVTWGDERLKRWPTVPTVKELGHASVSADSPYGIAGPKGMDPAIVKILHDAIRKAIDEPVYLAALDRFDQPRWYRSTEEYAKYARDIYPKQKALVDLVMPKQ